MSSGSKSIYESGKIIESFISWISEVQENIPQLQLVVVLMGTTKAVKICITVYSLQKELKKRAILFTVRTAPVCWNAWFRVFVVLFPSSRWEKQRVQLAFLLVSQTAHLRRKIISAGREIQVQTLWVYDFSLLYTYLNVCKKYFCFKQIILFSTYYWITPSSS